MELFSFDLTAAPNIHLDHMCKNSWNTVWNIILLSFGLLRVRTMLKRW